MQKSKIKTTMSLGDGDSGIQIDLQLNSGEAPVMRVCLGYGASDGNSWIFNDDDIDFLERMLLALKTAVRLGGG